MNLCIKQLVEEFDFNLVKKQKAKINAVGAALQYIIHKIDNREKLSEDEYGILKKYVGIYNVSERSELQELIKYFIKQFGNECNLNWIDVSNVTDMNLLFYYSDFNGDISQWNVSNVTNMKEIFKGSKFNGDISQWDVSKVTDMESMFSDSVFNGNISQWDVSNVTNMHSMFSYTEFNGDISQWNVGNVTNMHSMFLGSVFNGDISQWNVSKVTDKRKMFFGCSIKAKYKPKFK